jgi:aryl-alcohol dehydrogenase-like predicted oxidoreductase
MATHRSNAPIYQDVSTRGVPLAQVALAWLLVRPAIAAPIVCANTPEQLSASLGAADMSLSADQIARLDTASLK